MGECDPTEEERAQDDLAALEERERQMWEDYCLNREAPLPPPGPVWSKWGGWTIPRGE